MAMCMLRSILQDLLLVECGFVVTSITWSTRVSTSCVRIVVAMGTLTKIGQGSNACDGEGF